MKFWLFGLLAGLVLIGLMAAAEDRVEQFERSEAVELFELFERR